MPSNNYAFISPPPRLRESQTYFYVVKGKHSHNFIWPSLEKRKPAKLFVYFYLFIVTKPRNYKNKLNEIWKHTKYKCIFITTWATEICWNCFLKFNYLDHRYNQGIQTVHMDLVTDGGACFQDWHQYPESWYMYRGRLPGALNLKRHCCLFKKQKTTQKAQGTSSRLLEDCRN